jgi:RNA polymerase sigma-70 factor (ECF subfamily)
MVALLYPKYFHELTCYAYGFTKDWQSAEDLTQETFLRAMKNTALLEEMEEKKCRAWLYKTLRNLFIDLARRKAAEPAMEEEGFLTDDLSKIAVEQILSKLSPGIRQLVLMRYFEGFNSTEIGTALSLPAATVRTRLASAVKDLKRIYNE